MRFGGSGLPGDPGVSALAGDPYAQYCSPNVCHDGSGWVGFGGTSLSTPSWGAAVLLSEKLCATNVGFLNPLLYDEPRLLTGPVTAGNNDLTGTNRGLYRASASGGYSMAAGLGYLGAVDLTSGALCGPGNLAPSGGGAGGTAPSPTTTTTTVPVSPTTVPLSPTTVPLSPTTVPLSPTTAPLSPTTMPVNPGPPPPAWACSLARNRVLNGTPVAIATSETDTGCAGYWIVSRSGDVATFGSASDYGSLQGSPLTSPIVAATATPDGRGYWLLAANGTVFPFGDAERYRFAGTVSAGGGRDGGRRAAGIAVTPDGKGYWTVDADAVVSAFGDAKLYGPLEGKGPNRPVVGIAATSTGKGYWLVSSDGGVFNFGDAKFLGSLGNAHLNSLVVGITTDPAGNGLPPGCLRRRRLFLRGRQLRGPGGGPPTGANNADGGDDRRQGLLPRGFDRGRLCLRQRALLGECRELEVGDGSNGLFAGSADIAVQPVTPHPFTPHPFTPHPFIPQASKETATIAPTTMMTARSTGWGSRRPNRPPMAAGNSPAGHDTGSLPRDMAAEPEDHTGDQVREHDQHVLCGVEALEVVIDEDRQQ